MKLDPSFFDRPTIAVARGLLGCTLVHVDGGVIRRARIVETEAYLGGKDRASHSHRGPTPRTAVMFGPPGHAYLFLIYGAHWCFNVVTEREGRGAAVLIRAGVPLENCDGHLTGPGAFARGMHLNRRHYGTDLRGEALYFEARTKIPRIVAGPRVNVDYAGEWAAKRWRFAIEHEPAVSRPRLSRYRTLGHKVPAAASGRGRAKLR